MSLVEQIDWITWKEFAGFAQMGFALGVGYTVLRLILAPIGLVFAVAMKALFD
jgi:hypothetical protein